MDWKKIYINNKEWIGKRYDYKGNILFILNNNINGKGKEYYDNGELLYDGGYLNGKRNGKGKEYDLDGKLIFEGEYLNDLKWNGKGKEYYDNGKLLFEGEYLNDLKWNGKKVNI